ncbi:Acetolactate synthase, mitochondrial, partial [Bifiguratus adelaidae]
MDDSFIGLSGGEIFHEMMLRQGVKHVFGYPGGAILPVFDAIHDSDHFEFILPRHEQGAGHMAEGYARATGKPGVVLVTSGPGATNAITPMQDALSDGTPMVVFCGQVPTSAIGTDAFQEADVVGISRPCTKWNVMVKDITELPRRINEAFEIATSGRPGPVLVDLPKDVTGGILTRPIPTGSAIPKSPIHLTNTAASAFAEHPDQHIPEALARVAELINKSKRPVIYAGQGVLAHPDGPAVLKALADQGNIPVTTSLCGLGAFDELDPKSLHMLGMHGSGYANMAMQNADAIIALGARFDDRVTGTLRLFAPEAKKAALENRGGIFHFEIMPKNINKVVEATHAIEGDVTKNVSRMLPMIQTSPRTEWFDTIDQWKKAYPWTYAEPETAESKLKPQQIIDALDRATRDIKDKVIITTGVGQHQMWAAQHYRWRYPRTFITSGGLGTMGYGLPSAIGAKVACPDKIVIDVDGDASFSMTAMELATAAQFNIGVKVLLLNNSFQGMVKQWQDLFYEERYSGTTMVNPDFVQLAEAMHVKGLRISKKEDIEPVMKEFLEHNGPVVLDCVVEKNEHVYPMVPAGKGDGVGPEVCNEAVKVIQVVAEKRPDISFDFSHELIGLAAIAQTGEPLPQKSLDACRSASAVLLGAVGGVAGATKPGQPRPEQGLLKLRKELDLYANLRPVIFASDGLLEKSPLKAEVVKGTEFVFVRELVGGIYFGNRKEGDQDGQAYDTLPYSKAEIERVTRLAAYLALGYQPPAKIHSIDKANVLATSRLWRKTVNETLAAEFPQLLVEHHLVDSAAMHMVANPTKLNGIVLTENMFGDILSDEASVICGSLGLMPSASLSGLPDAPDIAGQGICNPIGTILSAAMLLRYSLGMDKEAQAVEAAVRQVLDGGMRTKDLGGQA